MDGVAQLLVAVGGVLLLGLATESIGRRTHLPRVTLLLVFGFLVGPGGFDVLPESFLSAFDLTADVALVMVGFLLGGQFTASGIRKRGREVLLISLLAVIVTAVIVCTALLTLTDGLALALLLAGIAPATAPAATLDVVRETRADGPFTRTLLGVVALDDAWGLILFSFMAAAAAVVSGVDGFESPFAIAAWEIGMAALLGLAIGFPAAFLTGRVESGEPTLIEALGIVFLCAGLAVWLEVSYLITSMVVGAVVVNFARHHSRPFHAIEGVEWPFMVLFFVMAGASLEISALGSVGFVTCVYVISRVCGRIVGGWTGGMASGTQPFIRQWIGVAMMPQAGVALGMALFASNRMPELRETLLPVVIASTVLFELTGPVLTRWTLFRIGEAKAAP